MTDRNDASVSPPISCGLRKAVPKTRRSVIGWPPKASSKRSLSEGESDRGETPDQRKKRVPSISETVEAD